VSRDPIAAVCFDFAGTLFSDRDLRDIHLRQLRFVAAAAGVEAADDRLRAAYRTGMGVAYRSVASRSPYTHRELFGAAFVATAEALDGEIDEATAQAAVTRQYRATIEHAVLRPGCRDTLLGLRRASVHVQIVSNIDDEQLEPMLDRLGLHPLVDAVTSSDAAGVCKPNPAIYRLALAKANVEPGQGLFVGDSLHHDVAGPAAIGMQTAWLAPKADADPGAVHPDTVIHALPDVLEIVRVKAAG
jgi:HAD superfamily hydrolase (TIGR01509 family)